MNNKVIKEFCHYSLVSQSGWFYLGEDYEHGRTPALLHKEAKESKERWLARMSETGKANWFAKMEARKKKKSMIS
jgi:hypothetical protein